MNDEYTIELPSAKRPNTVIYSENSELFIFELERRKRWSILDPNRCFGSDGMEMAYDCFKEVGANCATRILPRIKSAFENAGFECEMRTSTYSADPYLVVDCNSKPDILVTQ